MSMDSFVESGEKQSGLCPVIAENGRNRRADDVSIDEKIQGRQIENNNLYLRLVNNSRFRNMHGDMEAYLVGLSVLGALGEHYDDSQRRYSDRQILTGSVLENLDKFRKSNWNEIAETVYNNIDEKIFSNPKKPEKENVIGVVVYDLIKLGLKTNAKQDKRNFIKIIGENVLNGLRNSHHCEKTERPYVSRNDLGIIYTEQYRIIAHRLYNLVKKQIEPLSKEEKAEILRR